MLAHSSDARECPPASSDRTRPPVPLGIRIGLGQVGDDPLRHDSAAGPAGRLRQARTTFTARTTGPDHVPEGLSDPVANEHGPARKAQPGRARPGSQERGRVLLARVCLLIRAGGSDLTREGHATGHHGEYRQSQQCTSDHLILRFADGPINSMTGGPGPRQNAQGQLPTAICSPQRIDGMVSRAGNSG